MAIDLARLIHSLRGQRVMLDCDIAGIYGVETRTLNQAVKRHPERFPPDFMFELTRSEIRSLSQSVISSGFKYAPRVAAFTETGVAMLSSILRSRKAIGALIDAIRESIPQPEVERRRIGFQAPE